MYCAIATHPPQKHLTQHGGVGVYSSVLPVKTSQQASQRAGVGKSLALRWRIQDELRRLKANRKKLRQAMLEAEQMKSAIANWSRKQP